MFSFLKNHPFAVEAFFKSSLVLTFAIPKEQIQHLIPECLQLDVFKDKWAFIAVAFAGVAGRLPHNLKGQRQYRQLPISRMRVG